MTDEREIGCPLCGYTTYTIERYWGVCPNGCPSGDIHPELYEEAEKRGTFIHTLVNEKYGIHVREGAVQLHATDSGVWERAAEAREMARL